jgi:hypothetical protein
MFSKEKSDLPFSSREVKEFQEKKYFRTTTVIYIMPFVLPGQMRE